MLWNWYRTRYPGALYPVLHIAILTSIYSYYKEYPELMHERRVKYYQAKKKDTQGKEAQEEV